MDQSLGCYYSVSGLGIRSSAHPLIHSFAHFAQIKWVTVRASLRSLKTNERLWANRSGCSEEMSDHERYIQVAQREWKICWKYFGKKNLKSCFKYVLYTIKKKSFWKMSELLIFAHFIFFGERCERFAHNRSFPLSDVSVSLRSLTKNEQCEQITQVAHQKWATMSASLTSLKGNERLWANRSDRSPKMRKWVIC